LNGPPGAPDALCPGTAITSIKPTVPFVSVPHTGQFAELLQPIKMKIDPKSRASVMRDNIFDRIKLPPEIFAKTEHFYFI
jgi:hypothetical protein